jgi:hypothetical protein
MGASVVSKQMPLKLKPKPRKPPHFQMLLAHNCALRKEVARLKKCPNCELMTGQAMHYWAQQVDADKYHKQQSEIALGAILALLAEGRALGEKVDYFQGRMDYWISEAMKADTSLQDYVASFDAHRTNLREIMDCARRDIRGTIYFRDEDARRLEEMAQ